MEADDQRCQEAEAKIELIAEWINAVTNNSTSDSSLDGSAQTPTVVVDDFSPRITNDGRMPSSTLTLGNGISHMDLASLSQRVGTLTLRGKGLGLGLGMGKMLREESRFDLAGASNDEVF